MIRRWLEKETFDTETIRALADELKINILTAELLLRRGITDTTSAQTFLTPSLRQLPSPLLMKGMEEACARIIQAIVQNERIVVYGDYDVDGVTSTTLLMLFFKELGVRSERLHFFIPNRVEHGYGLQKKCIPHIVALGCDVLITVDCGITSCEEIDAINEEGIETIIIDHHIPPDELPKAYTILNPQQEDCTYPDKRLAAVGVAYQLLIGLRTALREHGYFKYHAEPNLLKYIDLVALGTVADIVPLLGVNRILVFHGLKQMKNSMWVGLNALLKVTRTNPEKINTGTLGFQLGPRINAAGRLNDASLGVKMLCSEHTTEAERLAQMLDQENQARKDLQERMFEQARGMILLHKHMRTDCAIVLAHEEWHPGVIGIVASKLVEEFHRPTVLIALDPETGEGKGSCRSIPDFNIHEGLKACQEHLLQFGGHAAAAGLSIRTEDVDALRTSLVQHAQNELTEEALRPQLSYDAQLPIGEISESLILELQQLEPHGMGNSRPVFVTKDVEVLQQNTTRDGRHLQLTVDAPPYRSFKAIAFGKANLHPLPSEVALAYVPELNEWRGQRRIQLNIRGIRTQNTLDNSIS